MDLHHASRLMDDPDPISQFHSFRYPDDRNSLSNQNPGSRYTDGSLDPHHVSPQTDDSDSLLLFQDLKCPDFLDLENSDIPNVDIPISQSFGTSTLLFTKLNLVQLPTDLTAVGYFSLDLTVQICPSCALLLSFLPGHEIFNGPYLFSPADPTAAVLSLLSLHTVFRDLEEFQFSRGFNLGLFLLCELLTL
jgi:hypothetical protein